LQQKADSENC